MTNARLFLLGAAWLVLLGWCLIGVWPVAISESDGAMIAFGVQQAGQTGAITPEYSYRFEVQTGTYTLVRLFKGVFGGDPFVSFSLLSALAALGFAVFSARLAGRLTGVPVPMCGLLVLLFQEVWASAYYPSSTVLSAALWCASFDVLARTEAPWGSWLGGVLLGVAIWVRADAVVMLPMVPFLFGPERWTVILRKTARLVVAAATVSLVGVYASGSGVGVILESYRSHVGDMRDWALSLKSYFAFFSLLVLFLIAIGLWETIRQRNWRVVGLLVAGGAPLPLLLGGSVTTPKYLLYLVPALVVVMAQTSRFPARFGDRTRHLMGSLAALMFVMQYFVGVQVDYARGSHPRPCPTLLGLVHRPLDSPAAQGVSLVVGAGATITTHDSIRLSSGLWFANLAWRHYKSEAHAASRALTDFLHENDGGDLGVFAGSSTEARLLVCRALYRDGYLLDGPRGETKTLTWRKAERTVRVLQGDLTFSRARSVLATDTVVIIHMWDQDLHRRMKPWASAAKRLAGDDRSAHSAYVVLGAAPPPR